MTWLDMAIDLAKQYEGCRLEAYPDPVYGWRRATVGYGATGPSIVEGTVWTQEEADADLLYRMEGIGSHIDTLVMVPISDEQKGALCDLAYNIGLGALSHSTLLRMLNGHNEQGAADQFLEWVSHHHPEVNVGLGRRRNAERALFLLGCDFTKDPASGEGEPQPEPSA